MDGPKDIWHFARTLFAKQRMGKSTFLERDLIPAASRQAT
jgi:hypothetical protein